MFWVLDAYYLSQERKFRSLYNSVRTASATDFSMSTEATATSQDSWPAAFFSRTLILFHGTILAVLVIVIMFFRGR